MKKIFMILVLASAMLTSCTIIKKTATSTDVQLNVCQYPMVADLNIKNKIEATKTWNFKPFHIGEPKLNTLKGNFIAEILKENNADVLLEPQFLFSKTSYGERRLTVTGYPATYSNFRKATEADLEALKKSKPANERTVYNLNSNGGIFGFLKK